MAKTAAAQKPVPVEVEVEELTVASAARDALEAAGGDPVRGTEIMAARAQKEPTLYRPLMDPLLKSACYRAVVQQCNQQRRAVWHSKQPSTEEQRLRVVALADGTMRTLYDFQLPHGPKLGAATRKDVMEAVEQYGVESKRHIQISADMKWKQRWLQLIGQHMTGRKKVSQAITSERLAELREEATRD